MNLSELTKDQIDLILTLFQLQNGERLLSDFTDVGSEEYVDLKIKDLKKLGGGLIYRIWWISYNSSSVDFHIYSRSTWKFKPFPIFDCISFEDKI